MKITRKRRHEAMLEQGMHAGNTDSKFDPPDEPRCDCGHLFEICNHPNCPTGDAQPPAQCGSAAE